MLRDRQFQPKISQTRKNMANYYCTTRTNYYRVTDEQAYAELFAGLHGTDDSIEDFSEKLKDGTIVHGFGTCGSVLWFRDHDAEEDYEDEYYSEFLSRLQKLLPAGEAFIMMQSGHEKLRYVTGYATVVTADSIEFLSIADLAVRKAREMLGDDHFKTQLDY